MISIMFLDPFVAVIHPSQLSPALQIYHSLIVVSSFCFFLMSSQPFRYASHPSPPHALMHR
jgi:hypothetical protein